MTKFNKKEYPSLEVQEVRVEGQLPHTAEQCVREAIKLCIEEWVPVELKHGHNRFIINPDALFRSVEGIAQIYK